MMKKDIFFVSDYSIDISGMRCPKSMMMIRKFINNMKIGETLLITTDDLSSTKDITIFCIFMQHELVIKETTKLPYRYVLRKTKNS